MNSYAHIVFNFIIAIILVSLIFMLQGHSGLSLWDEGYLWYGAQRTYLGEVPILDFKSYDPLRYYFVATIMSFFNDNGIIPVRITIAIWEIIGLFFALMLIDHAKKQSLWLLSICLIIFAAWMFPYHKIGDITVSILLVGILTFLIKQPTKFRYFITGCCIGIISLYGRNHGMYGVFGVLISLIYIFRNNEYSSVTIPKIGYGIIGIIVGFSPILIMMFFISEFAESFLYSVQFLLDSKATNLSLPVPWPWLTPLRQLPIEDSLRYFLVGFYFIGVLFFAILSVVLIFLKTNKHHPPVLLAALCLALPYMHYAYSRADAAHLANGIFPFLIGIVFLISQMQSNKKYFLIFFLAISSIFISLPHQPKWQCYINQNCVNTEISGYYLEISENTAKEVSLLKTLSQKYKHEDFLAVPFWPGAYALLNKKSPLYVSYIGFPRGEAFEKDEVNRIKLSNIGFVIINNLALDGQEDRTFKNLYPLVHKFLKEKLLVNFIPVNSTGNNYSIFIKKTSEMDSPSYIFYNSKLIGQVNKVPIDLSSGQSGLTEKNVRYNMETCERKDNYYHFRGWATLDNQDSLNTIEIIIKERDQFYKIDTYTKQRKDVTKYLNPILKNNYNYDSSGFEAFIPTDQINNHSIEVYLSIFNSKEKYLIKTECSLDQTN